MNEEGELEPAAKVKVAPAFCWWSGPIKGSVPPTAPYILCGQLVFMFTDSLQLTAEWKAGILWAKLAAREAI